MDGAEVGVLEEANKVGLSRLLEGEDGRPLEAEIGFEVLGDLADEALEGELADEELGGLLVATDLAECDGAGTVSVGLLHSAGCRGRFTSGLRCELFARSLATCRLPGCLLSACHDTSRILV